MPLVEWFALIVFSLLLMSAALYGLAASGQFPSEHRAETFKSPAGAAVLWGSMAAGVVTALVGVALAWLALPWYAAVIAGGGVLLIAPLILQLFPDSFVDGRSALLTFAGVGAVLSMAVIVAG